MRGGRRPRFFVRGIFRILCAKVRLNLYSPIAKLVVCRSDLVARSTGDIAARLAASGFHRRLTWGASVRHFGYLTAGQDESLFARAPEPFGQGSGRDVLAMALGATLYTPGTRADYASRISALVGLGVTSAVLCLEDAISDADVPAAERNVAAQLIALHRSGAAAPLMFVRVRHPDQIRSLVKEVGDAVAGLSGFVFPKFTATAGAEFFEVLAEVRGDTGLPLYGMPVLESPEI